MDPTLDRDVTLCQPVTDGMDPCIARRETRGSTR